METIVKHKLNNVQKIPFIGKEDFIDWKQRAYLSILLYFLFNKSNKNWLKNNKKNSLIKLIKKTFDNNNY
jgi:hypothetical protein